MHSWAGGKNLINPILRRQDLPVILGDVKLTKLTLQIGWHALSLAFLIISFLLAYLYFDHRAFEAAFLLAVAVFFLALGISALVLSRGKHLSWVFFLPVAAILALKVMGWT